MTDHPNDASSGRDASAAGSAADILAVWEKTIDLQMHFNDMCLQLRKSAVTVMGVLLGAGAVAFRFGGYVFVLGDRVPIAFLFVLVGLVVWLSFYAMDRYWYHELLRAAVEFAEELEGPAREAQLGAPLNLSAKIRSKNRASLGLSGGAKINLFYGVTAAVLVLTALALVAGLIEPLAVQLDTTTAAE